jgi:hypothetical protein
MAKIRHKGRTTASEESAKRDRRKAVAEAQALFEYRKANVPRWLAEHDADPWWHRYQVHPYLEDATAGHYELKHMTIEPGSVLRVSYMLDIIGGGEDRDPGAGTFAVLYDDRLREPEDGKTFMVPWMSDTRAEIVEHLPLITELRRLELQGVRPRVLINGLGLGMAVQAALAHGAEHVDVVELDPLIVAMCGQRFDNDPRVVLVTADAFAVQWSHTEHWDVAWHDIWPFIEVANLPEMAILKRKYAANKGASATWQGCWQEDGCRDQKRRSALASEYDDLVGL